MTTDTPEYLAGQVETLAAELTDVHRENESLGRTLEQAAATNDDLVQKVARLEKALFDANASLHELKALTLIGPLTAEEWLEFRQRTNEDEQHELLQCCGNTSEARDLIFTLMRSYAEDRLLGARIMARVWEIMQDHGMPEGRGTELLTRLHDYYQAEAV